MAPDPDRQGAARVRLPPLLPPRLLLTRPPGPARRFLRALERAAGRPVAAVLSPVMGIEPLLPPPVPPAPPAGLLLTSEAGARAAGGMGLGGRPAWVVGPRTAAAAAEAGLEVRAVAPDAAALLCHLLAARPPGPLLHVRGEHAAGDLASRLRAAGIEAEEAVAYRQPALPPTPEARAALAGGAPLLAPLFSARSARLLAAWGPRRAPLHVVAPSAAVARAAAALGPLSVSVAARPEGEAMVEAVLARLRRLEAGEPGEPGEPGGGQGGAGGTPGEPPARGPP